MISIAHPDFREELERQAYEAQLLIPASNPENSSLSPIDPDGHDKAY